MVSGTRPHRDHRSLFDVEKFLDAQRDVRRARFVIRHPGRSAVRQADPLGRIPIDEFSLRHREPGLDDRADTPVLDLLVAGGAQAQLLDDVLSVRFMDGGQFKVRTPLGQ